MIIGEPVLFTITLYYLWTLWPNDFEWRRLDIPYASSEDAEGEKLMMRLTGYDVRVLPASEQPSR